MIADKTILLLQPKLEASKGTKDDICKYGIPNGKDYKDGRGCPMAFTWMGDRYVNNVLLWLLKGKDGSTVWIPLKEIEVKNYSWRSLYKD